MVLPSWHFKLSIFSPITLQEVTSQLRISQKVACVVFFCRGKAQGVLNDWVSPILSLAAKQKKQELPAYLGLSHALHYLKQTHLHIHLRRCTQRDSHTVQHTLAPAIKSPPLMQTPSHASTPVHNTFPLYVFEPALLFHLIQSHCYVLFMSFNIHKLTYCLAGKTQFCRGKKLQNFIT